MELTQAETAAHLKPGAAHRILFDGSFVPRMWSVKKVLGENLGLEYIGGQRVGVS